MEVQLGVFIWTLVVFGILFLILLKWAFPAILGALKEREEGITNAIESAENKLKEAEDVLAQSQAKLDNAQKEINEMIAGGKSQAEKIIQKATEEAEAVKAQKLEDALKEIERNKEKAIGDIKKQVADLVIMATEKILVEKLDQSKHQSLIENYVSNLNKN
jgi:F-type H+-transporting ATPase subunit b